MEYFKKKKIWIVLKGKELGKPAGKKEEINLYATMLNSQQGGGPVMQSTGG